MILLCFLIFAFWVGAVRWSGASVGVAVGVLWLLLPLLLPCHVTVTACLPLRYTGAVFAECGLCLGLSCCRTVSGDAVVGDAVRVDPTVALYAVFVTGDPFG